MTVGLSPRLWGTQVKNTWCFTSAAVYPHACGEHDHQADQAPLAHGLSPRLWGTRDRSLGPPSCSRFIPTPVGNTWRASASPPPPPVYPHACGEHTPDRVRNQSVTGLSPRLWGTLLVDAAGDFQHRFIPTPVGNTPVYPPPEYAGTVYPHACGEHGSPFCSWACIHGLSPRLWGTRNQTSRADARCRFIPTPVGNTLNVSY